MPNSLGQRLKFMRGNEPQKSFAKRLSVGLRTLQHYESDERKPSAEIVHAIARLGWNPAWLLTGEGEQQLAVNEDPVSQATNALANMLSQPGVEQAWQLVKRAKSQATARLRDNADYVLLDRHWIRPKSQAGKIEFEQFVDSLAFKRSYFDTLGFPPDRGRLVRVRGDSMEPELSDGDLVLVDTGDTLVQLGSRQFALCMSDTEIAVRRVCLAADGRWQITGGRDFAPCLVEPNGGGLSIVGRARRSWRKYG